MKRAHVYPLVTDEDKAHVRHRKTLASATLRIGRKAFGIKRPALTPIRRFRQLCRYFVRSADVLCPVGHVVYQILLHHIDLIGDREILAAAADYENGGNAACPVKLVHTVCKGRDRLFLNQLLHHAVPNHKVCGASVLVNE